MFNKYRDVALGIVLGLMVAAGIYMTPQAISADWPKGLPFSSQQLAIIKQTKMVLETYQVDGDKKGTIDDTKMYYGAMKGLVSSVGDPFTRFVEPKELEEENLEMEGEYGGLGIYITSRDGRTIVIAPIENTPADRVGLKPLDEIVKVDEKNVIGMTSDEVVKLLRGPAGKSVKIGVRRKNEEKLLEFVIVREIIKIKTVRLEMLGGRTAYIKINQFNLKTDAELEAIIKSAKAKKATGILLDLRNNPGGLLNSCVDVTSQFISGGVVVGMKGRFEKANDTLYAVEGRATKLPVVALVNEGSASAAEILAGALKDHKRATIVGKKTFGKGSVQSLFNLPDNSGIYITIARYTTPSGFVIDHKGLEPNVKVEGEITKEKINDKQLRKGLEILRKEVAKKKKQAK
ncbi:MAG: S41 family peptidase [Synergistaceae bacterium]|jgi:carboxyl-terminal processing protease|nr:S41 family peptidase [Synergistaceae bacterium]PKL04966.1 MAG: S41 family peptidase [Synergistetes bacterium HGW-Synergistetes-1]MBP9559299.1 S41 family peptidase [Synergistaceae bacterium]MBP9975545.1 S41 family peptidase [Synergistaceae bacterium]MCE5183107.1 S41 family peptidase [Synergistaceae bacterium]